MRRIPCARRSPETIKTLTARPDMIRRPLISGAATLFLGTALFLVPAFAQDQAAAPAQTPAAAGRLDLGLQARSEDGDLMGVLPVELSYKSATRAQLVDFALSLPVEFGNDDSDDAVSLGDWYSRLVYSRQSRNSALELEARYYETDLDREILFDDITETLVTVDRGSVADQRLGLGYVFGTQSKVGGELGLGYRKRDYTDTTDPDLYDAETVSGDLSLFLEPTSQIRARLVASESRTDSYGEGTDTRDSRYGIGASLQLDKLTNLDLEVAQRDIHRDNLRTGEIEDADGPSVRFTGTRARPNGDWSLTYETDPGTEGRRDNLMFGRSIETSTYQLNASLGATRFSGDLNPIYHIAYERGLNDISEFRASLRQAGYTDDDGDESLNTDLSLGYRRQLTGLSSLGANIRYRASDVQTGDRSDAETVALNVNYSHALANDFSFVAGFDIIRSNEDDDRNQEDGDEERIYLGVNRSFDFLP